ncbi:MAG: nicotinate phosphoribosyltransferase [Alphaproteobacteria bacterium]
MRDNVLQKGTPLFCDLYHLTMAQAWFNDNKHYEDKISEAYFRKCPFGGAYLIAAGLAEFLEWIENWKVTQEDINYLETYKGIDDKPLFTEEFLYFLKNSKLEVNIRSVEEGQIVFPNEPVLVVRGPCWQVDMVEAAFLNIFNSQSLIATKASRIVHAAQSDGINHPVLEFGLRRSQELGSFTQTRASFIGGCVATSNVEAARAYGIPAKGTMAHSYIMTYENELDAFKSFMKSAQGNATLLVDTYDTREGILNAIKASEETKIPLQGIRIDSGDLAYWSKEARKLLNEKGFEKTKIVISNDLDEYSVENIIAVQKACPDIIAAGTKLVTAYDMPALGGVFKVKEVRSQPKIKIAEGKTTIPGATNVVRIYEDGKFAGDVIVRSTERLVDYANRLNENLVSCVQGIEGKKKVFLKGSEAKELLRDTVIGGKVVQSMKVNDLYKLQNRVRENLEQLDESHRRLSNPHLYGVGLSEKLLKIQNKMITQHNNIQKAKEI